MELGAILSRGRLPHFSSSHLARRDLATSSLVVIVSVPIVLILLLIGAAIIILSRRRHRRRIHQNSPTTSMVRNSIEEDLESYRQERERMGDVIGAGVSQEDLENQLRGGTRTPRTRSSAPASRSVSSSTSERKPRSEIEGFYSPTVPQPASVRNSRQGGSRPQSGLRNSIQAQDLDKEIRGFYETPQVTAVPVAKNQVYK